MKLFDLTGRVAIVTGGNGGLGLAMAQALAEAGARIIVSGRDAAKGAEAVAAIGPGRCAFVENDVTREGSAAALIAAAVARFGRLDILFNNAGMNIRKRPEDYSLAEWRLILETNLTAAFACAQAAYPEMRRAGGGKIVNIGSMTSIFGKDVLAPYGASKGGLVQMTKALAGAWAKDNIQVNAILPGWIDTELSRRGRRDIPGLEQQVTDRTPAGRWGKPADLAGAAVFFASSASDFVTGATLAVDGGFSAQG